MFRSSITSCMRWTDLNRIISGSCRKKRQYLQLGAVNSYLLVFPFLVQYKVRMISIQFLTSKKIHGIFICNHLMAKGTLVHSLVLNNIRNKTGSLSGTNITRFVDENLYTILLVLFMGIDKC